MRAKGASVSFMQGGVCAVCSAPQPVRDGINVALRSGEPLRQIEKRSGFSRAGLSRHKRSCLQIRREDSSRNKVAVRRHRDAIASAGKFGKVYVVYSDGQVPKELGPDDWVIKVEYIQPSLDKCGNPRALIRGAYDGAVAEHLARFPNAKLSTGEAAPTEELQRDIETGCPMKLSDGVSQDAEA